MADHFSINPEDGIISYTLKGIKQNFSNSKHELNIKSFQSDGTSKPLPQIVTLELSAEVVRFLDLFTKTSLMKKFVSEFV